MLRAQARGGGLQLERQRRIEHRLLVAHADHRPVPHFGRRAARRAFEADQRDLPGQELRLEQPDAADEAGLLGAREHADHAPRMLLARELVEHREDRGRTHQVVADARVEPRAAHLAAREIEDAEGAALGSAAHVREDGDEVLAVELDRLHARRGAGDA